MVKERLADRDRIVADPEILCGKPTVRGTRIAVELVLAHLAENPDMTDLFAAYPRLTIDDVRACLAYAEQLVAEKGQRLTRRHARRISSQPPA